MAIIPELVRTVALSEGMDEETVALYARRAREAGFIAQKGRGKAAAKMGAVDAANLLIAVNAATSPNTCAVSIPAVRMFTLDESQKTYLVRQPFLTSMLGPTFGDALEALIRACHPTNVEAFDAGLETIIRAPDRRGAARLKLDLPPVSLEVEFRRPNISAEIRIVGSTVFQKRVWPNITELTFYPSRAPVAAPSDRRDIVVITDRTIRAVAATLAETDEENE